MFGKTKEKELQPRFKMFSIRDTKAEAYSPPFCKMTHGEAERDFTSLANDSKTNVGAYPEDYDLFYVADYCDVTGKVTPLDTPQHISKAINVKRPV